MKPTRTLRKLGFCLLSVFTFAALTGANAQTTLYGTTGGPSSPGSLYTIDPGTGIATFVGPLVDGGNNYAVTGLAFDATGVLYGSTSSNSPVSPSSLVTINPSTGAVNVIGAFNTGVFGGGGSAETMADFTFDFANSILYGGGSAGADLYKINLSSGQATLVNLPSGVPPGPSGVGMALSTSATIYGAPTGASGNLYLYDTGTGAAAPGPAFTGPVPYTPTDANNKGAIAALAFSSSSVLYGVDVNLQDATPPNRESHLITINTGSGAVTDIGLIRDIGNNPLAYVDAIVFAIPEPATWLIGALSLGGIIALRARRS